MLWYKAWLETRWRFYIGLALLICSAATTVFGYPKVVEVLEIAPSIPLGGELGRRVQEAIELARTFRGYVWSHGFHQDLAQAWVLFAALLGAGGLLPRQGTGGGLFTLALPITRNDLLKARAGVVLAELFVLALVPALLIALFAPAIGQRYPVGDALVHGLCLFVVGSAFFSLAFLLSTLFRDVWRPLLIALGAAMALGAVEQFRGTFGPGVFSVMSAESWFRHGTLPWLGLLAAITASAAGLWAASSNFARQDF